MHPLVGLFCLYKNDSALTAFVPFIPFVSSLWNLCISQCFNANSFLSRLSLLSVQSLTYDNRIDMKANCAQYVAVNNGRKPEQNNNY